MMDRGVCDVCVCVCVWGGDAHGGTPYTHTAYTHPRHTLAIKGPRNLRGAAEISESDVGHPNQPKRDLRPRRLMLSLACVLPP